MPRIGDMREHVTIQIESRTLDAVGDWDITWNAIATVWASIKPVSTSDSLRSMALAMEITHKVTIRWRSDIGTLDGNRYRLLWNGAPLRVSGIDNPDQRRRFLELTCQAGQDPAA